MSRVNPCCGKYGLSMDIKFTDKCNGSCSFCIEKNGYRSKTVLTANELAAKANSMKVNNYLIVGGEPTLRCDLPEFLSKLNKRSYITTNGSNLTPDLARRLSPYLFAINISIHHYNEQVNSSIFKHDISLDNIRRSIWIFNKKNVPVRINCNLIPGFIDNRSDVDKMINFAINIGAQSIRFTELQNQPEFVNAQNIWSELPIEPFKDGCEHWINSFVLVKQTCGIVNKKKPYPDDISKRKGSTIVLYPDGSFGSWAVGDHGCHGLPMGDNCHPAPNSDEEECHPTPRSNEEECHPGSG